jgi:uncharacterized protein (TIGR00106 family)
VEKEVNGKREIACFREDGEFLWWLEKSQLLSGMPDSLEETMQVIMDLCIVPLGVGVSVSSYVAECHRVLQAAGLKTQLHAYGTNIEGDWDAVMAAVKQCHERVHILGAPRITTTIKLGTRIDRDQTMDDKVRSVEEKLG